MWYLYNKMYEEINMLKTELILEKMTNDIRDPFYSTVEEVNKLKSLLQQEKTKNEKLLSQVSAQNNKIINLRKAFYLSNRELESEKIQSKETIALLREKVAELLENNLDLNIQNLNQETQLAKLSNTIKYLSVKKEKFNYQVRKKITLILEEVSSLIKKLLFMGNQKKRRVKVIFLIKEKMAEYEDAFYVANLKLDEDASNILYELDCYLDKWNNFYQGDKNYEQKSMPINENSYRTVENLLRELFYISSYKSFERYKVQVVNPLSLYEALKKKHKIPQTYSLSKFLKEIHYLHRKSYFSLNNYFVKRIFPGELYMFLPSFKSLNYDFAMLKTYRMYNLLYICGNYEMGIYKVGVAKSEAERRIFEAKTTFKKHFNNDKFNQIKIIQSPNALNLEVYLKRLFKNYRHPLLESTEWFLLDYDAKSYMKEEKYFRDADFMKIHNFVVGTD